MKTQLQKTFRNHRKSISRDKEITPEEQAQVLALLASAINLGASIKVEVAPILEAKKKAESDSYLERNGVENSPELYGKSVGELQSKYHNPCRMHTGGTDANVECDPMGAAIIGATVHQGDVEKPL